MEAIQRRGWIVRVGDSQIALFVAFGWRWWEFCNTNEWSLMLSDGLA